MSESCEFNKYNEKVHKFYILIPVYVRTVKIPFYITIFSNIFLSNKPLCFLCKDIQWYDEYVVHTHFFCLPTINLNSTF